MAHCCINLHQCSIIWLILPWYTMSYISIIGTWIDTFEYNDNDNDGWNEIGSYCGTKGCATPNNSLIQTAVNTYHGPYYSIGGDGEVPHYNLSQILYCEYPSNVHISYKLASCAANSGDGTKFYFNNSEQDSIIGQDVSNFQLPPDSDLTSSFCAGNTWYYVTKTWPNIVTITDPINQSFEPKWEFYMNAFNYFVVYDISITCDGSANPSSFPSNMPTSFPSQTPTSVPSNTPTLIPSHNPTSIPSYTPTIIPSDTPTSIPTRDPSLDPTHHPTYNPTLHPTFVPTFQPTSIPTLHPTDVSYACNPELHYTASWSESYLSIKVRIINTNNALHIQAANRKMNCPNIFDANTNTLIGDDATCTVQIQDVVLFAIDLAPTSTIGLDDIITIQRTSIQSICSMNNNGFVDLQSDLVLSSISHPLQPSAPNIIISKRSAVIGVCDDLILNARSTTNLGGRDNALFEWKISIEGTQSVYEYTGSLVVIQSDSLLEGKTYHIVLDVSNWYGQISSTAFNVYVSNDATPRVSISGITDYSTTDLNLNGFVDMIAEVTFDDRCLNEAGNIELEYEISWTAMQNAIDRIDAIVADDDTFGKLTEFLQLERQETLSIDASELLQSGFMYVFTVNVQCIGNHACDVDAVHQITFHTAPIHCMIMTNDITLDDVDPKNDLNFAITLDGDTFTYDPDSIASSLQWSWDCVDAGEHSCDYLLDYVDSNVIHVDLSASTFEYHSYYLFTVDMIVSDTIQIYRDECFDSFTLQINTKKEADTHELHVKSLIVTVTSISTEITKNDRLRLLGNVINY
eukprot:242252_1